MAIQTAAALHVDSEVGELRQVVVHRPGLELTRLTPGNVDELLFDDVMWAARAREEHDSFVGKLRDKGVVVHEFSHLLAGVLDTADGREFVLSRTTNEHTVGPQLVEPLRELLESLDGTALAETLIGGVLKHDLSLPAGSSLLWDYLVDEDFVLAPLPNTLFQRDNIAFAYSGVSVHPMAVPPREAFLGVAELVAVEDAVGRISCESIAGYPPGIPAILPGERMTAEISRYLRETLDSGGRLHGSSDPDFRSIHVLRES